MFRSVRAPYLGRAAFSFIAALLTSGVALSAEVNVYSYREPGLTQPLFDKFTAETGIQVNSVYIKDGLMERVAAEGANSPADVLLTVDISRLAQAKELGVSQPVQSDTLDQNIPASLREPNGLWFALTMRARVIYASKDRVAQDAITYEELADPKWRGKLCTRSGQHDYNLGLISSMIAHHGEAEAQEWLTAVRDNLARKPAGNDRSQVKGIFAGECDIALGNTYYMGLMETNDKEPEQKQWAAAVKVLFPNAGDRGTHVNVSGMALAKHAPHPQEALKLMEFLSSAEAQQLYAQGNFEYPVKTGIEASDIVKAWGDLKPDQVSLDEIAKFRKQASEMVDKVAFDEGPSS